MLFFIQTNKLIFKENGETKETIEKEYSLLKKLKHPFIIKPKEILYDEGLESIVIIQEFFSG